MLGINFESSHYKKQKHHLSAVLFFFVAEKVGFEPTSLKGHHDFELYEVWRTLWKFEEVEGTLRKLKSACLRGFLTLNWLKNASLLRLSRILLKYLVFAKMREL